MGEALHEARLALDTGEVPVGAVLVAPDGRIIGRGHNSPLALSDPTAHAEIAALRRGAAENRNYRLENTVLVVTLEPCLMCVGAMVHARIAGLVYGAADTAAGAVASRLDGLELPFLNHRVWFAGGVREQECAALLHSFFEEKRHPR